MNNIEINSPEEITLFTDEEEVVLKKINFELEQSHKMRGFYNKLTIFNDSHCYQLIRNKHHRKMKFRLDINCLNPLPTRQHKVEWKWLFAAIPFLMVSLVMAYAGLFSNSFTPSTYFTTVLVGALLVSFICILLTVQRSYDRWVYKSEFANIALIELLNNQPDSKSFKTFTDRLTLQIRKAKLAKNKTQSELLAAELRELRRLKDETVISSDSYESAKQIIFKHEGFSNNASSQ